VQAVKIPKYWPPAGKLRQHFWVAVENGADAVYLGGKIQRRYSADNFTEDDIAGRWIMLMSRRRVYIT
jgi:collagenase-like PrtC family protease